MITEDQYWLAQPPQVRALRNMDPNAPDRGALAVQLARGGCLIDGEIMVSGWGAQICMGVRKADGMTWVPSLLQPSVQSAMLLPGENPNPPFVPYDPASRPAGSIKVSDDPVDYPAFDPPPPPPPAPVTDIVGGLMFGNYYKNGPGAMKDSRTPLVTDGQTIEQGGAEYTAHVTLGMFGYSVFFTKN